jgi:DNA-binding NtrC family response regulator
MSPDATSSRLLIVDDDPDIVLAGRLLLRPHVGEVVTTGAPDEIPVLMRAGGFDAILLDMNFARGASTGQEGLRWLGEIKRIDPDAVVIVITAHGGVQMAVEAMKQGATDFVSKPWSNERLVTTVRNAIALRRTRRTAEHAQAAARELSGVALPGSSPLLGTSSAMRRVLSLIERAAPTDANVLILGENGTGKELVARELHRRSQRAGGVFASVDLGAVSESLFDSELFGHKKGAFTDARSDRIGRFQAADGGTLFLDEIGNLPLHLQPKLLTALEQRQVVPIGANAPIAMDVRVVSATNMPVSQLTDETRFRPDLLFRLNTVEITLPPLRERRDDIPILLDHFNAIYAKRYGKPVRPIASDAREALIEDPWPGNVRALRHAVERAVILASGDQLSLEDFPLSAPAFSGAALRPQSRPRAAGAPDLSAIDDLNLDRIEREVIEQALRKHAWNISFAAKALGLTRASLYRRMEKHGL